MTQGITLTPPALHFGVKKKFIPPARGWYVRTAAAIAYVGVYIVFAEPGNVWTNIGGGLLILLAGWVTIDTFTEFLEGSMVFDKNEAAAKREYLRNVVKPYIEDRWNLKINSDIVNAEWRYMMVQTADRQTLRVDIEGLGMIGLIADGKVPQDTVIDIRLVQTVKQEYVVRELVPVK